MSKYDKLWVHLRLDGSQALRLTFDQIEAILGFEIDHSFLTYKKEAASYGYLVGKISLKEGHVSFQKIDEPGLGA